MGLKIARGHEINLNMPPFDTQGLRVFVSGMSGAGKSYTEMKFLEEAYNAKMQFCLLDVHGEGHVLGELGDNVMIASDRFGIPVLIEAIPVYLDALQQGMSLVIDLKPLFFSDEGLDEFFQFMYEFLSKFLAMWSKVMTPILIAFDEAQEVMPQSPPKGIQKLFNKCKQLVLGGRKFGIHYLLASQRTALIDKTPISQANVRLFGKVEEETDYNAIKPHLKYTTEDVTKTFTMQEIKQLRSGEFVLSSEGEASKVKILSRKTTDAGATPTFVPSFSEIQKRDMGDIANRIQELIAQAEEERKRKEEEESELAKLRRSDEKSEDKIKELERKLDTVEFIQSKMTGTTGKVKEVDPSSIYADVREEMDKEFATERKQFKQQLASKDSRIMDLEKIVQRDEKDRENLTRFRTSFLELIGVPGGNNGHDIDTIVKEVLKRLPASERTPLENPLEAIQFEWQQRASKTMLTWLDELRQTSPQSVDLLLFLLVEDKLVTKGRAANAILGSDSGSSYQKLNSLLSPLLNVQIVKVDSKQRMKIDIDSFIRRYLGEGSPDEVRDDVYAAIYQNVKGGIP